MDAVADGKARGWDADGGSERDHVRPDLWMLRWEVWSTDAKVWGQFYECGMRYQVLMLLCPLTPRALPLYRSSALRLLT